MDQVFYDLDFFLFRDVIEIRCEDIEIEIQNCILWWDESSIFIELEFVLYADHSADETRSYRWLYIVSDIAGVVRELPCIFFVFPCPLEI